MPSDRPTGEHISAVCAVGSGWGSPLATVTPIGSPGSLRRTVGSRYSWAHMEALELPPGRAFLGLLFCNPQWTCPQEFSPCFKGHLSPCPLHRSSSPDFLFGSCPLDLNHSILSSPYFLASKIFHALQYSFFFF